MPRSLFGPSGQGIVVVTYLLPQTVATVAIAPYVSPARTRARARVQCKLSRQCATVNPSNAFSNSRRFSGFS